MSLTKLLSIAAWTNTFVLVWVIMFVPIERDRWLVFCGFLFFFVIAMLSSMAQSNEEMSKRR